MALFKSFFPSVTSWKAVAWNPFLKLVVDNETGAPVGVQSQNANGPNGIWAPVPLSSDQIASPTAAMVADTNATYQLNVAPWTRYQSNGTILVQISENAPDGSTYFGSVLQTVPAGTPLLTVGINSYLNIYSPWTVQNAAGVAVQGTVYVTSRPA